VIQAAPLPATLSAARVAKRSIPSDAIVSNDVTSSIRKAKKKQSRAGLLIALGASAFLVVLAIIAATVWLVPLSLKGTLRQARVDPDTFNVLYRVSKEIEGAQETGLTRGDFAKLLQRFATELSIAKDRVKTDSEKQVLQLYSEALSIWKDSDSLWAYEASLPQEVKKEHEYQIRLSIDAGNVGGITKEHDQYQSYMQLLIDDKLPIQDYDTRKDNTAAFIAKRWNLLVKEDHGWKWINARSFKQLWLWAGEKATAADNLAKGGGK
jgi:hypothetical protein